MNMKEDQHLPPSGASSSLFSSSDDDDDSSISHDDDDSTQFTATHGCNALSGDGGGTTGTDPYEEELDEISGKEDRRVRISRIFVGLCILAVGAVVSTTTFFLLDRQVEVKSRDAFFLFANAVKDNFKFQVQRIFESNRALSRAISISAADNGAEFPCFSVPSFEAHAHDARHQAGFEMVTYAPVANKIDEWVNFSQTTRGWLDESKVIFDSLEPGSNRRSEPPTSALSPHVWRFEDGHPVPLKANGVFVPSLHTSPPPGKNALISQNEDMFSDPEYKSVSLAAVKLKDVVFSPFSPRFAYRVDYFYRPVYHESLHEDSGDIAAIPHSLAAQPVYKGLHDNSVVGYIYSIVSWDHYLLNLIPDGVNGIFVILRACDKKVAFELVGRRARLLGSEEAPSCSRTYPELTVDFADNYIDPNITSRVEGHCQIFLHIRSSARFATTYNSNVPCVFTVAVALMFCTMAAAFYIYDRFVQTRNDVVTGVALQSNALIKNLFPSKVREQLMQERKQGSLKLGSAADSLKGFLSVNDNPEEDLEDIWGKKPPIAELYPETTIMFNDMVGFTAWSSVREPSQVFQLLETVYHRFDEIARQRRVFKVETIGDCYVAVCGLPDPRRDHATAMARFARHCMQAMSPLTKRLETKLGPDTHSLTLRIGLHSGPVTAGVLRAERCRFQLFGDTMNTASRMESTGTGGRIHISEETASLLCLAGKSNWIEPRLDRIHAKGKGELQTYWLSVPNRADTMSHTNFRLSLTHSFDQSQSDLNDSTATDNSDRSLRLVEWNVETLQRLLKDVVARRELYPTAVLEDLGADDDVDMTDDHTVIDEVKEIISLPDMPYFAQSSQNESCELDSRVQDELKSFVTEIRSLYKENPFHNFEHASHVTMSVLKLLSRIKAPTASDFAFAEPAVTAASLHDHTYGITSDPLTQFACVFSALVHDLDHEGVPNQQLVKENTHTAQFYKGKSVAEQNAVDLAWKVLMQPKYSTLRRTIFSNFDERKRFRQLVVNSVIATDIVDKELKALRNDRWDRAFGKCSAEEPIKNSIDRKATIVIEHLIQASDVAHTMQHWHVYRKWNERFFLECYRNYLEGRADVDPSTTWYQGEIGFFDFYIIPLAKKLKDCGVFGVSSDEYLIYAQKNRQEWQERGQEVVAHMIETAHRDQLLKKNKAAEAAPLGSDRPMPALSRTASVSQQRYGAV